MPSGIGLHEADEERENELKKKKDEEGGREGVWCTLCGSTLICVGRTAAKFTKVHHILDTMGGSGGAEVYQR